MNDMRFKKKKKGGMGPLSVNHHEDHHAGSPMGITAALMWCFS